MRIKSVFALSVVAGLAAGCVDQDVDVMREAVLTKVEPLGSSGHVVLSFNALAKEGRLGLSNCAALYATPLKTGESLADDSSGFSEQFEHIKLLNNLKAQGEVFEFGERDMKVTVNAQPVKLICRKEYF